MATLQHNITTILTQDLLTAGDGVNSVKYISIANTDSSKAAIVNLFLNKLNTKHYLMKNYRLRVGETLFLNKDNNIAFDNSANGFSLRIQTQADNGSAIALDVIITR